MFRKANTGILFDGEYFSLKKAFEISCKEDLKSLLLRTPTGLIEDDKLKKCYTGICNDIEEL